MRKSVGLLVVAMVLASVLLFAKPGLAIEHGYIEDFSTNQYKDGFNTTAWWDSTDGEIKLFPFVLATVGTCATPGSAFGVTVDGDYAFVADGSWGLQVIDISDPTAPTLAGTCNTPGFCRSVAISGGHAFVADYATGLLVIDISDPTSPTLIGGYNTSGTAYDVAVSGDHAFVADDISGLQVIDISDPTAPTLVGALGEYWASEVAISGNYAFAADWGTGLRVIDISDPTNPWLVGTYAMDTGDYGEDYPLGVTVSGDHVFVADLRSGLHVIRAFQSDFDANRNVGRSLAINFLDNAILKARVVTRQTNKVTWELSTDGGVSWQGILPNGSWNPLTVPGSNLLWRSTHSWAAPGLNPSVTQLEIDWLFAFGVVDAIEDIPNDQGRQVRITWGRSGNDFVDASPQITEYAIYRKIDANLPLSTTVEGGVAPDDPTLVYPPGNWDFIMTVPADAEEEYSAVVPTLADSTIAHGMYHTTFFVRARTVTPGVYFDSYPDSGYSVDNLSPSVPAGFVVAYNTGSGNHLTWEPSPDQDFRYFKIYRGTSRDFVPGPGNEVQATAWTEWTDSSPGGGSVYYKVTALDFAGNERDPASPESATGVGDDVMPKVFALYQNVPNPFNPQTVIRYDVPVGGGKVTLQVFDVSGKLVRTLLDGMEPSGQRTVRWDGRNENGEFVASGIYFYRMTAPGYVEKRKMAFLQ